MPRKYSEPCVTPAYSEPWYIQNPGIFRARCKNPGVCRIEVYSEPWNTQPERNSEPCQISTMECCAKIGNSYSCFCKLSFLQYQILTFLFLAPKMFLLCKKILVGQRGRGYEF